jgi:predicted GNAT family N-acyltransferase
MVEVLHISNIKDKSDIYECSAIRRAVFHEEQGFPLEAVLFDDNDFKADHFLLKLDGQVIGNGRIYRDGDVYYLGRVALLKEYRGKGYGKVIVNRAVDRMKELGGLVMECSAQITCRRFYESLGFKPKTEEIYQVFNINHIDMYIRLL